MIRAGYCTSCGAKTWRDAVAQKAQNGTKAGQVFLLWPDPTSVYAMVKMEDGYAPGVGFCRTCLPPLGVPVPCLDGAEIVGYEPALERYTAWFSDQRGIFFHAFLVDQLSLAGDERDRMMLQWHTDRGPSIKIRLEEKPASVEPDVGPPTH